MSPNIAHERLHNQHISRQKFARPDEIVGWLGALQGQDYAGALWSIGLRLRNRTEADIEADIEQAIAEKRILRTWALRGTLHFVAADDLHWLLALVAPRIRAGNARRYKQLGLDESIFPRSNDGIANTLQGGKQLTREPLFAALEAIGISTEGQRGVYMLQRAAIDGLICLAGMQGNKPTFMIAPEGETLPHDQARAELARRYFASHGPATLKDFIWWSGLSAADARAGLEVVKAGLVETKIGSKIFWRAETSETTNNNAAYLLPGFDEFVLGYTDRAEILDPQHTKKVQPGGGMLASTIVIDGRIVGIWKRTLKKERVVIAIAPFRPMAAVERDAVVAAAERYGKFLGMSAELE